MKMKYIVGAVVAVVILFALGILSPGKIRQVKCRIAQHDGTSTLKEIRKRVGTNLAKGDPARNFDDLNWQPKTSDYDYNIAIGFNGHFTIEAKAEALNGDVWTIDEVGTLTNKVNGCELAAMTGD